MSALAKWSDKNVRPVHDFEGPALQSRLYMAYAVEVDAHDSWARMSNASLAHQEAGLALDAAVKIAREDGRTWQEIADATGMQSRQAAQKRWGR